MLESVLIANRGEIAARIVRACRDAGIRSIAVYSDADRHAEHVALADEAVYLGEAEVQQSYLSIERIVDAGLRAKASCVHPGYGLLSENADFARSVTEAGMVFVGPTPGVIEMLGDKRAARAAAAATGIAVLPGCEIGGGDLASQAEQVGYPLVVKAAFGGGGRGMRIVRDPGALSEAVAQALHENEVAFGHGDIYLERFVERARHVEVQVLSDMHGNVRHLGTRDCTIQRRNQKLIEEAPAFGLPPELEARALEGATRLASTVTYQGAGTVEFLVNLEEEQLFFLEVNTRLQVEHTVTEAVTGIDIVAAQLAIAGGAPIGFSQEDVSLRGHAIEARVNAEDVSAGFLPQTGTIDRLRLPAGPWVRVDSGVCEGAMVSRFYDSLLAKITAWGPDRETSRSRLARALSETRVSGLPTTAGFLAQVLDRHEFRSGSHWTAMVDEGKVSAPPLDGGFIEQDPAAGRHRRLRLRTPSGEIQLEIPVQQQDRPRRASGGEPGAVGEQGVAQRPSAGVAPMDSILVRLTVEVGDVVDENTTVAIVESMKMETQVVGGVAGTVTAVHVGPGDSLRRGERLVTIEEAAT